MNLLLVSATSFEISDTADWLNARSVKLNAQKHEWLISGVGQMQTAYLLAKKIASSRPDLVIQAGIAGSTSARDIGKTFVIRSETLADLGVLEKKGFSSIFDLGLDDRDRFPYQDGKLANPYRDLLNLTGLPLAHGFTVNEIKAADLDPIQRNSFDFVESMEGAALHFVCLMEKIPFLQIRSVSNVLGERDKTKWKFTEARENLHQTLMTLIQKLENADETLFRL